jgi:hypothetical protein
MSKVNGNKPVANSKPSLNDKTSSMKYAIYHQLNERLNNSHTHASLAEVLSRLTSLGLQFKSTKDLENEATKVLDKFKVKFSDLIKDLYGDEEPDKDKLTETQDIKTNGKWYEETEEKLGQWHVGFQTEEVSDSRELVVAEEEPSVTSKILDLKKRIIKAEHELEVSELEKQQTIESLKQLEMFGRSMNFGSMSEFASMQRQVTAMKVGKDIDDNILAKKVVIVMLRKELEELEVETDVKAIEDRNTEDSKILDFIAGDLLDGLIAKFIFPPIKDYAKASRTNAVTVTG